MQEFAPPSQSVTAEWLTFLTPISVAVLTIVNVWISKRTEKHAAGVKAAVIRENSNNAIRANEVKHTLEITTAKATENLDGIHKLVNSERGVLLEMYATAMETNATLTKDPKSEEAARIARAMVDDHRTKQAEVDADLAAKTALVAHEPVS